MKTLFVLLSCLGLFSCAVQDFSKDDPASTMFNKMSEKVSILLNGEDNVLFGLLPEDCDSPTGDNDCRNNTRPLVILEQAPNGFILHTGSEEDPSLIESHYFFRDKNFVCYQTYYSIEDCIGGFVAQDIVLNRNLEHAGLTEPTDTLTPLKLLQPYLSLDKLYRRAQDSLLVISIPYCKARRGNVTH
ncbi:hypothetical protein KC929_01880 [Patescibacteria group bacterium]|nr:hypothetical protein [Patescibacteria group bacterium]